MTCVKLETTLGDITIELNLDAAPETSRNFLNYVESGFYSGTVFHRVIDGFMIQGGGMDR
ncbi:MAG: peptidylprolyl isomerase, partial [Arenicellales bacterium]